MARATASIVIYRLSNKAIIATLQANERYYLAETDLIFQGTLEEFQAVNKEYKLLQDIIKNDSYKVPFTM